MSIKAPNLPIAPETMAPVGLRGPSAAFDSNPVGGLKGPSTQVRKSPKQPTSRASLAAAKYQTSGAETISNERLVVLLYERLVRDLETAENAIHSKKPALAHEQLVHAQAIIEALQLSLDATSWNGAEALDSLYDYCHVLLVKANITKDPAAVSECLSLISPVALAWSDAWTQLNTSVEASGASRDER